MDIPRVIKSGLERMFWELWHEQFPDLPSPEPQYRFIALAAGGTGKGLRERLNAFGKKYGYPAGATDYRADFCWADLKLIVEIEGKGLGHESWGAIERDIDKYNMMTILGYRLLRYSRLHLIDSKTAQRRMLKQIVGIVGGADYYENNATNDVVSRINKLLKEGTDE